MDGLVGRSLCGTFGWFAWWFALCGLLGGLLRVVWFGWFASGGLLCLASVGSVWWFGVGWPAGGSEAAGAGHKPACRGGDTLEVALVLHDGVAAQQRGGGAR